MFRVKYISVLEELGFKEYRSGYSKKIAIEGFDFIEFDTEKLVLKKVKFSEDKFIEEDVTYENLQLVVSNSLKITLEEIKKYIEKNFERIKIWKKVLF